MHAGQTLDTRWVRPTQWTQPFPACVALEPTLPNEDGVVGMREVSLEDAQVLVRCILVHVAMSGDQAFKCSAQ